MKAAIRMILGSAMMLGLAACQMQAAQPSVAPTLQPTIIESAPTDQEVANSSLSNTATQIDELSAEAGYEIHEPDYLPAGYTLENAILNQATQSVCLQYRHEEDPNSVLWIAQGPMASVTPLESISGWPETMVFQEPAAIGGAEDGLHLAGWRRNNWGCSEAAQAETTPYTFTLAPRFAWQAEDRQFEIYSASAGCAAAGGVTNLDLLRVAEGLTGVSTHPADELDPECLRSVADAVKLSGFDISEPTILPAEAAFYYATYEASPDPGVTLHFYHKQHAESGTFFRITLFKKAPPYFASACGENTAQTCEVIQAGSIPVVYQFLDPTEQLDWQVNDVYYSLFRNAGEPGKKYKDELVQLITSMK